MSKNAAMYLVVVKTGATGYTEDYKVYSHELMNYCLILNIGTLKCGARSEVCIPVSQFHEYYTADLDE